MVMANGDMDYAYDPGDDVNLTNLLNGMGNDVGMINTQANSLTDNDTLNNPSVSNNAAFNNSGGITGGEATSDDGISAESEGGNGAEDVESEGGNSLAGGGIRERRSEPRPGHAGQRVPDRSPSPPLP